MSNKKYSIALHQVEDEDVSKSQYQVSLTTNLTDNEEILMLERIIEIGKNELLIKKKIVGLQIRDQFIKFLKQRHAHNEFLEEIAPVTMNGLGDQFMDGSEFVLEDGCLFFYRETADEKKWSSLSKEWKEVLSASR